MGMITCAFVVSISEAATKLSKSCRFSIDAIDDHQVVLLQLVEDLHQESSGRLYGKKSVGTYLNIRAGLVPNTENDISKPRIPAIRVTWDQMLHCSTGKFGNGAALQC